MNAEKLSYYFRQIHDSILNRISENWGFPFIISFLVLLLTAAILLSANMAFAEQVAECAYFVLALGVALQLVGYSVRRRKEKMFDGPS